MKWPLGTALIEQEDDIVTVRQRARRLAELLGFKGIFCDDPEMIGAAWDEALAADRPVIMNMKADPNVPPLPPHITLKDAKNFMTMMADEPELASVVKNSARQMFAGILPGKE